MNSFFMRSAVLVTACGCIIAAHAEQKAFKLKQTIPLPGVEGRIDHLALDAANDRLFVCALGNNTVEVLDLRKGERIHSITGLGAPQGIAYIPELNRIFVANDKGGIFRIYDGKSFEAVGELDFKDDADNVRYDSATKQIYIGFGSGGIAIVNAPDGKQIGSIKLSAHPEAFELEKQGKRIFVNVPTALQIAVVDRDKGEVIATWGTGLAFGNFPIALDETNCRLPPSLQAGRAQHRFGRCYCKDRYPRRLRRSLLRYKAPACIRDLRSGKNRCHRPNRSKYL